MTPSQLQTLAAQLRKPEGDFGKTVGQNMNHGNALMNRRAIEALNLMPGDRVLELGMGNGAFVPEILGADDTVEYTGVDFSPLMVEEATRQNQDFVDDGIAKFVQTEGKKLPFGDKTFHKALTVNTIYFWEKPVAMLAEFRRVLKRQGTLVIAIRPKWAMEKYPFSQYGFTLYGTEELSDLLQQNGFIVSDADEEAEPDLMMGDITLPAASSVVVAQVK